MRMEDPKPTFSYLVRQLAKRYSSLSYIHVVEPRAHGNLDREVQPGEVSRCLPLVLCTLAQAAFIG